MPTLILFQLLVLAQEPDPLLEPPGQALAAMEQVARESLPQGFGYEWSGLTS